MVDGRLDLAGLDRELVRAGLPRAAEQRAWWIGRDPWTLWAFDDRGDPRPSTYADEDAVCRAALVGALLAGGATTPHPRHDDLHRTPGEVAAPARPRSGPPTRLWSRTLRPRSRQVHPRRLAGQDGLVVDTEALWRHGVDGAVLLTALDRDTGDVRWSAPVAGPGPQVLLGQPGLVLAHTAEQLTSYDPHDGGVRWSRAFPRPDSVAGLGASAVALHVGLHVGLRGGAVRGLDLATGADRYEVVAPPPPWAGRPRLAPRAWWSAEAEAGVVHLRHTDVDDGEPRLVAALPHGLPGLAGTTLHQVATHTEGARRRIFLRVRRDDGRGPLLVVDLDGGAPPRWADASTGASPATRSVPVDREHVLTTGWSARDGLPSRLVAVDGAVRWQRPDLLTVLHREPGFTVCQRRATVQSQVHSARLRHDDLVVAIDDRGRDVWRAGLGPAAVAGDELWHCRGAQVAAVGLRDGRPRWSVPAQHATPWPIGLAGVEEVAAARTRGEVAVLGSGSTVVAVG